MKPEFLFEVWDVNEEWFVKIIAENTQKAKSLGRKEIEGLTGEKHNWKDIRSLRMGEVT